MHLIYLAVVAAQAGSCVTKFLMPAGHLSRLSRYWRLAVNVGCAWLAAVVAGQAVPQEQPTLAVAVAAVAAVEAPI